MAICLDIDADFLFKPRSNGNILRTSQDLWLTPEELLGSLRKAGLRWPLSPAWIFTNHKEAYFIWREQGFSSETLVHVDAHADLYDSFPWMVHCGNFLRKAVEEGRFCKVIWVVPPWLYVDRESAKRDLPGFQLRTAGSQDHLNRVSHGSENRAALGGANEANRHRQVFRMGKKAEVEVVPLDRFRLSPTKVKIVTLATSPLFVSADGYPAIKDLVRAVARECGAVSVRADIPLCLEDPVLGRDIGRYGKKSGSPTVLNLDYLWAEHRRLEEREREHLRDIIGYAHELFVDTANSNEAMWKNAT